MERADDAAGALSGWQLAAWVGSVLAITAALIITYPLISGGGGQ
jgi:hypothetical protein